MADTLQLEKIDFVHYFNQLLNVCDDDITSIALRFFPKGDDSLRKDLNDIIKAAITSPWSYCNRLRSGTSIHQSLWHICQSFLEQFNSSHADEVLLKEETKLLEFHLTLLFAHKNGLLSDDSVLECCSLWQSCTVSTPVGITASTQLATQLSAMLLKDPILGSSILTEIVALAESNTALNDLPLFKQICTLFSKAVQTAADDLPYIDTLSPQAQSERIFTVFYLLSKLQLFTSLVPLSQTATTELVDSLVVAASTVRPFMLLVKDSKIQFATLCGQQLNATAIDSMCELVSKALLGNAWAEFEDCSNTSFSKVVRLFSGLVKKKSALSDEEKLFWLFLASFTEKKTYIELFITSCKECLAVPDLDLLKELLEMKPFCHNKAVWFLLLIPHCQTLSQTLSLRTMCFPNQNSQLNLTSSGLPNATLTKLSTLLTFFQKLDVLMQRAESFDEMSQEKLRMQLGKYLQTSLFFSSDLGLIEYFLDIGELHPDAVISLIVELANVSYQPSGGKIVRFKMPAGSSPSDSEPLSDSHILAQIFSYYAYCALRNMTDAVYGCSVYLTPLFKDEYKNSIVRKIESPDEANPIDIYSLAFTEETVEKYKANCTQLLDYGRTYCRIVYPLGLRLEVIENAFSLLFVTYDHVHERIQEVAEEEFEAEGDMDKEEMDKVETAKFEQSKGGSMTSSLFTHSTLPPPSVEPVTAQSKTRQDQIVGCLANEFLFRDMLFMLNECTKELVGDIHRLDTEGVSFRLSSGHLVSMKMADDISLSDHMNRDTFQLPGFKDRLYRLQRGISEALWRLSIVSGVVPFYSALELTLSQHDYFKREFKTALATERNGHTSGTSARKRTGPGSDSTLKGAIPNAGRTAAPGAAHITDNMRLLRNGFVEKLASSAYMLALCWSANRRDLERCEQILGSYPDKFDATSEFAAEVKFQRGLNAFIADVLLMGPVAGNGGKRLRLAIPFESPSKLNRTVSNRSGSSLSFIPSTPTSTTNTIAISPSTPNTEGRMSMLSQLVATSLTQFEIKEKLNKLVDGEVFGDYVNFFMTNTPEYQSRSPFGRPAVFEAVISRDSLAAIATADLAFCYSPNLEAAAALLSNLGTSGLVPLQTLIANYLKYAGLTTEFTVSDLIANSLKWFTSTKLIQPDWTPSGVLVSPLFNVSPDLVARTRSGIMSLSRLITMTSDALQSADHDKAEAMLTQVVSLLSGEWVETAARTVFLRSMANRSISKANRWRYLSSFWGRLKEMYRSLGELGLQKQQQQELKGPLDLLAFSPESIFSQIIFSPPTQSSSSKFNIEEIAQRLNVDLLQTIATCSCAQLPPDANELSLELIDELFTLAINDLLESEEGRDTIGDEVRHLFTSYHQRRQDSSVPVSSIAAQLWISCSEIDGAAGACFARQPSPPSHRLSSQTAKLVYDRNQRLFVLVAFLSDFGHLLASDTAEEKTQPEITAVKAQLRSLKARITENFRPLLTYMSLTTIPLVSTMNPAFPSSLDSILLLPSPVKATLLVSDLSTWFTTTVLRSLMAKPEISSGINSLALFDILPDPVNSLRSVIEYRDMAIIYAVESFFVPSSQGSSGDLDLSRVVQMIARISDPCLRLAVMRRHCFQFTLSGFDFLVLTCLIPKAAHTEPFDDPATAAVPNMLELGAALDSDPAIVTVSKASDESEQKEKEFDASSIKELVDWLHDWQKRIDLWMRLANLMRLDVTTTTIEHVHSLITTQSDFVADSLISAGDFSTGLQLLNVCGAAAFPVSLATRLMSAYLTSHMEETMTSPEQQARVVHQLDILATSDPRSCQQLIASFLGSLVQSSASAACIAMSPSRVCALLDFCKSRKIRDLLENSSKEDALLIDQLDQMVAISRLLPEDLKEVCGPLIHKPLLLLETLVMNVKVELAAAVVNTMLKSPIATPELEVSVQNIVAVYAFKALELPTIAPGVNNEPAPATSQPISVGMAGNIQRKMSVNVPLSSSYAGGISTSPQQSMTRPFLMPVEAPEPQRWMQDTKSETCMACHRVRFSMFARRHHCRRCGRIICGDCSKQRATVRGEHEVRVCDDCYAQMLVIGEHSGQTASGTTPVTSLPAFQKADSRTAPGSASVSMSSGSIFQWQLTTDDESANSQLRQQFSYESAPNLALCLSVLSMCQNPTKAAQLMLQIVSYLSKYLKPTREIDAALVLSIMKQLLMRAKVKFTEHSSDAAMSSGLATMCDSYSKAIDFLDSLLQDNCQPIPTVSDLIGRESSQRILSQLLSAERYAAAVRLASLMRPDLASGAWLRWGLALLRVGCYESARQKFVKCLPKPTERRSARPLPKQLQEVISTLESVAKRHPNIVADLVSNTTDRTASMTIKDLLAEPPQLAGKGTLMTEPLPKQIFEEAVFYLTTYGNDGAVVSFYQRHGYWAQAARYILDADCLPEAFVTCLLLPAASAGRLLNLEDQMLACDPTMVRWEKYISVAYQHLTKLNSYSLLHRLYVFAKDYIRAANVCLRHFFPRGARTWMNLSQNVDFLHQARGHLEAYIDRSSSHWGKVEPPAPKRPTWEEEPPMIRQYLPQAEVQRLSNAISLQFEVLEVMRARVRGNPSVSFASSNSNGTVKTLFTDVDSDKMAVVTELLMSASLVDSFPLARRIVTDFRLDPRVTYGNLGHELARSAQFDRLRQLLICLRDVLTASQGETSELIDDIICAAVRGIHDRPEFNREQDALIAMLSDDDAKIEACLLCAKLRSAYLIATHGNRERDVRRISEAASRLNQPTVKQICDQWLDQFNKDKPFGKS